MDTRTEEQERDSEHTRGVRFHDLRHTQSLGVQGGIALETMSRILGHSTILTTTRYARWYRDDRTAAAERMQAALGLRRVNSRH